MAFSNLDEQSDVMSEINMVPLIDIMLVLLIIFIITVPVIKQSITLDLPQAAETATETPEEPKPPINLSIASDGGYFLDTTPVSDTQLAQTLAEAAQGDKPPSLHIKGDKNVRYERIAQAMEMARNAGLQRIGFVTDPKDLPDAAATPQHGEGRRGGGWRRGDEHRRGAPPGSRDESRYGGGPAGERARAAP